MNITDFYEGILESLGFEYDKATGVVTMSTVSGPAPVTLETKAGSRRLVIPYHHVLQNPDWDHTVAFHPICENVARTDSDVLKFLQRFGTAALNYSIDTVMENLITWCADKDNQQNLNHKQNVFLSLFPNADDKAVKAWNKISNKIGDNNLLVKIATLRNKELGGQTHLRVAYVRFPFYRTLVEILENNEEPEIFGVKVRKKDVEGFKALFEYIFKHVSTPDEYYSVGSRSNTAPTFHAFISAFVKTYKDVVRVANLLKLKDFPSLKWADVLTDINPFRGQIPPLPGNEGEITEADKLNQQLTIQAPQPVAATTPILQSKPATTTPTSSVIKIDPATQLQPHQPVAPVAPPAQPQVAQPILKPTVQNGIKVLPTQAEQQAARQAQLQTTQPQTVMQQPVVQQPQVAQAPMMQPVMNQMGQVVGYQPVAQPMVGQPMMGVAPQPYNPFMMNPNLMGQGQVQQLMPTMPSVNTSYRPSQPYNPMMGMAMNPYVNTGYQNPMVNQFAYQQPYGQLR